ncbi:MULTISPECIES: LacI family DNA-binding transcriptional regulator [unclassified Paludibacterium]|uniref:LacI family DNA-binding transcriptional regulator n=1 Tax=unclassified Paludibacterium TaxID=2618429 RepID=UPI001C05C329|nr:LacI family DNA-binding transcriptional regulator [Paludibacterium sp. B53371]BEV70961.1 substrate-binding domain-containing protein [Paludibacterium sp. THUN1379]
MSVKIKDVAVLAGVSVATVSRALGNGPVSQALRQRVMDAVSALGYHPNLSARRLRSSQSGIIGLIVADILNPFFTAVSRAVEDVAYRHGQRVILCNADEDRAREAMYLRLMAEERVSGVIFAPTGVTARSFRSQQHDFPIVMIDREAPDGLADVVVLDNHRAAGDLTEHLIERGYRRILGLFGSLSVTGAERCAGYEAAMRRHGLSPMAHFVRGAGSAPVLAGLMHCEERPEAVLASNGLLLLDTLRSLRQMGLAIPADVALAGFDNDIWTELVGGGLTVIEQPVREIGATAVDMLLARIAQPDLVRRKLVLAGQLRIRGSTPGPSGRSA